MRQFLTEQQAELTACETQMAAVTVAITRASAPQPLCQRLEQVRGIGPLGASALWLKLAGGAYQNGRHVGRRPGLGA